MGAKGAGRATRAAAANGDAADPRGADPAVAAGPGQTRASASAERAERRSTPQRAPSSSQRTRARPNSQRGCARSGSQHAQARCNS
jgi:hypothetical protein